MEVNRKSLLGLVLLAVLFSCTRDPQQISAKTSVPAVVLESEKIRDSTLRVVGWRGELRIVGTGFFVARDKIATNIHVVTGIDPVSAHVRVKDGTRSIQGVTAFDVNNDLVILKISGKGAPLPLSDSDAVEMGEPIAAVGYPYGKYKVTEGVVHSVQNNDKWLWMKAALFSGNSGGPVLNSKGKVIGIVYGGIGYGGGFPYSYAIPSNVLSALLIRSGRIESLKEWQNRELIRSYVYFVQSWEKYAEADYDGAIVELDKAIQLNPDWTIAYHSRAVAKSFLAQSKVSQGAATEAYQYHQDAIDDYTQTIKLSPEYAVAYANRGLAQYRIGRFKMDQDDIIESQQHYQDAIEDYTKAVQLKLEFAQVYSRRARARRYLAHSKAKERYIEEARNLYKTAIDDRTKAIQLEPENAKVYNGRGWTTCHVGQFETKEGCDSEAQKLYKAAIEDYTQAIRLDPEYAYAYNNRGWAKYLLGESETTVGSMEAARKLYKAAVIDIDVSIQLDSDNAHAYKNRGIAKAALGNLKEAITDFDKAIQIDPEYAEVYYERGLAKEALNQKEASTDFEKAKNLDPGVGK